MSEAREVQALVIGGGPSGLALAYGLQGDTLVLEREGAVGGLCRTMHHDGGVFDYGGHSFHTPYLEVRDLLENSLGVAFHYQRRDARVYAGGRLIPYPFQKFFDQIGDPKVVRSCEEGLRARAGSPSEAANFEEFIVRQFGQGIADHFMLPYNRKLWARDLKELATSWTAERVASPKGTRGSRPAGSTDREPLEADTRVGYPSSGGYSGIFEAFVPHVPGVVLDTNVVHIDPQSKTVTTEDGGQYRWRFLASTMPLPDLVRIVAGTPRRLVEAADELQCVRLRIELLLTGRPIKSPIQRMYVGTPEIPPHKIAFNHASSPDLYARPHHAIMGEVSYSPDKQVAFEEIAPRTIQFLCDMGILDSPNDIIWRGHEDVKYGYPVYTHSRIELVTAIKAWMESYDIHTFGRFGDWEYINSDACIMKGLELASELRSRYSLEGQ